MDRIKICKICGREVSKLKLGMCRKHYEQYYNYGKVLDNNPRTVWDDNEIRIYKDYGEIDTYTNTGEVQNTFKFDLEDIKYLTNHKWRSVFKGKQKSPYLVTGYSKNGFQIIYFHRLVMGNPNREIDHINRDTTDNRKSNLRESFRTQQLANTSLREDNTSGIKGIYYQPPTSRRKLGWKAEISIGKKRFNSKYFATKAEAAYIRYLYECHFYKTIGINNSQEMLNLINILTEEQKQHIQKYFVNRMKIQVEKF